MNALLSLTLNDGFVDFDELTSEVDSTTKIVQYNIFIIFALL